MCVVCAVVRATAAVLGRVFLHRVGKGEKVVAPTPVITCGAASAARVEEPSGKKHHKLVFRPVWVCVGVRERRGVECGRGFFTQ